MSRYLTRDQMKMLEEIPGWKWRTDPNSRWKENFDRLQNFVDIHGELPKIIQSNSEERNLGDWCKAQKSRARI